VFEAFEIEARANAHQAELRRQASVDRLVGGPRVPRSVRIVEPRVHRQNLGGLGTVFAYAGALAVER
jgi:hypothetical protein